MRCLRKKTGKRKKGDGKMNELNVIEVFWDTDKVGKIALTSNHLCAFEYDASYLQKGTSISPFHLPLAPGVFIAKRAPFSGNFGVFNDSLPDGWGNLLLDRYLAEKGINPHQLSVLERLSLIGSSGRGALAYQPAQSLSMDATELSLAALAAEVEKILQSGDYVDSLDVLYKYGGSSGGARPKVFLTIDGEEWLVKFKATIDPENVGELEYQYALLAKAAGIEMPEVRLFEGKYFGVKRFDRQQGGKQHVISAAGLLHADYRIPSLDYSTLLAACLKLTRSMEEVYKLFRLMLFNVLIGNKDDHARNFSFSYIDGQWQLSPAYDLLPSHGFNGYHTTTINGQGAPARNDIIALAGNLKLDMNRIRKMIKIMEETTGCKLP
jgi:serine/threonine-protein kinase HipA